MNRKTNKEMLLAECLIRTSSDLFLTTTTNHYYQWKHYKIEVNEIYTYGSTSSLSLTSNVGTSKNKIGADLKLNIHLQKNRRTFPLLLSFFGAQ